LMTHHGKPLRRQFAKRKYAGRSVHLKGVAANTAY